jgi:hypothetical protein
VNQDGKWAADMAPARYDVIESLLSLAWKLVALWDFQSCHSLLLSIYQ